MNLDYTFFYTEANVVCIIIFVMLLIKDLGGVGRQAKQITFINIVIAHIFYFVSDIFWVLILARIILDEDCTAHFGRLYIGKPLVERYFVTGDDEYRCC